jgi:hypothetical protein
MAHDVFISYSSQDKTVADAACAALEAQKIRCWIAPRDVLPGTEYGEAIVSAIEGCRAVVLIFSAHANESPHIRREVERAVSKGKVILPFRIENVLPSRSMEYCLGNTHWLDALTPPRELRIAELVGSTGRLLEVTGGAIPPHSVREQVSPKTDATASSEFAAKDPPPPSRPEAAVSKTRVSDATTWPPKWWRDWLEKRRSSRLEREKRRQALKAALEWEKRPLGISEVMVRCSGCGDTYRLTRAYLAGGPRCGKCRTTLRSKDVM